MPAAPRAFGDLLVASSVKQKDGVVVAGRLNLHGKWVKRLIASDDVDWLAPLATLRKLEVTSPNLVLDDDVLEKLVFSGYLHQLEQLKGLPRAWLARLARSRQPWALQTVRPFPGSPKDDKERAALDKALAKGNGLPALADLTLTWSVHGPDAYRWVFDSATGRALRVLRINCARFGRELVAWRRALDAADVALTEVELYTGSTTVSLRRADAGWRITGDLREDAARFYGAGKRELDETLAVTTFAEVDVAGYQR